MRLTPQPDMEISTSQTGSGLIDPDFGASAAAGGEALPPAAAGTQQQTQHTRGIHPRTLRQAPATETPAAKGLTKASYTTQRTPHNIPGSLILPGLEKKPRFKKRFFLGF